MFPYCTCASRIEPNQIMRNGSILLAVAMLVMAVPASVRARLQQPGLEVVLNEGHFADTRKIAICADGTLAITQPEYRDDVPDDPLKLWDLRTGRLIRNFRGHDFALSADRKTVYINRVPTNEQAADSPTPVEAWDLTSGRPINAPRWRHRITQISADGRLGLSHDFLEDNRGARDAFVFNLNTGEKQYGLHGEMVAISDDLATGILLRDGQAAVYQLANGRLLHRLPGDRYWISGNGRVAISLTGSGVARVWRSANDRLVTLNGEYRDCLAMSRDGSVALLEGADGRLDAFDLGMNRRLSVMRAAVGQHLLGCALSGDARRAVALRSIMEPGQTMELLVYDLTSGAILRCLPLEGATRSDIADGAIALDPDRPMVVGGGLELFHCWDFAAALPFHAQSKLGRAYIPAACRVNRSGELLVCQQFYDEETFQWVIWDLRRGKLVTPSELQSLGEDSPALAMFRLTGNWAVFSYGGGFDLYDLLRGERKLHLSGKCIALSANDCRALVGEQDGRLSIYSLETMKPLATLHQSGRSIRACALSDDGHIAAALDSSGDVTIWDTVSFQLLSVLPHLSQARTTMLALGALGQTLVTSHSDHTLRIWSTATGELRQILPTQEDIVACYLSADEARALSITKNQSCQIWDLKQGLLLKSIAGVAEGDSVEVSATMDLSLAAINGVIWDLNAGRALRSIGAGYATITPDGSVAIVAGINGIELWNVAESRLLATAINYDEQWLAYTPDGFFDGSPAAWPLISWRSIDHPRRLSPVDQYFEDRYLPGLLSKIVRNITTKATKDHEGE